MDNMKNYPVINSESAIQNELTTYYKLSHKITETVNNRLKSPENEYKEVVKSKKWGDSITILANQIGAQRAMLEDVHRLALEAYLNQHPHPPIALHLMQLLNPQSNPTACLSLFRKIPEYQKESSEGKIMSAQLNALVNLVPGKFATIIAGVMPNGKPIDFSSMHKKLILIEFWRAGNTYSREPSKL